MDLFLRALVSLWLEKQIVNPLLWRNDDGSRHRRTMNAAVVRKRPRLSERELKTLSWVQRARIEHARRRARCAARDDMLNRAVFIIRPENRRANGNSDRTGIECKVMDRDHARLTARRTVS